MRPYAYFRNLRLMLGETRDLMHATRGDVLVQLQTLQAQLAEVEHRLADARRADRDLLWQTTARIERLVIEDAPGATRHAQLLDSIRLLNNRSHGGRERLERLRVNESYELAFSESEPLVSVVIPTYSRAQSIAERSIPSALAQTYPHIEVVVVGDAASDAVREAVEGFADPRVRFVNLPYRGPYSSDPQAAWRNAGTAPFNHAVRLARGRWIAPLDDDDAFRPEHVARLLEHARAHHLELAYCRFLQHHPDGSTEILGGFPPESGQIGLQAMLYHAEIGKLFQLDPLDAVVGLPNDWGHCLRMMEAGVRMGMLDEAGFDYYPSVLWERSTAPEPATPAEPVSVPEWEFVPEGWDRTHASGSGEATGWDTEAVAASYVRKWPRFLAAVEGNGPLGVGHEVPESSEVLRHGIFDQNALLALGYAVSRAAATSSSRTLSVLDWGGALGHHYVLIRQLFPQLPLDYHCSELPAVAAAGRQVLPEVSFHDGEDGLRDEYDLVFASSSLQYDIDWRARLAALQRRASGWLMVTRIPTHPGPTSFVVVQRAHAYGYDTEYLGWVFSRGELLDASAAVGLTLEREFVLLPEMPISGAPAEPTHDAFLFRASGAAP